MNVSAFKKAFKNVLLADEILILLLISDSNYYSKVLMWNYW